MRVLYRVRAELGELICLWRTYRGRAPIEPVPDETVQWLRRQQEASRRRTNILEQAIIHDRLDGEGEKR